MDSDKLRAIPKVSIYGTPEDLFRRRFLDALESRRPPLVLPDDWGLVPAASQHLELVSWGPGNGLQWPA